MLTVVSLESFHNLPGSRCTSHADRLGASCLPCHCLTFFWYFHLKLFLQLFQESTSYDQRLLRAGNQEKSFKNHLDSPFLPSPPPSLFLWICISPTPPSSFPSFLLLFCFVIETWSYYVTQAPEYSTSQMTITDVHRHTCLLFFFFSHFCLPNPNLNGSS